MNELQGRDRQEVFGRIRRFWSTSRLSLIIKHDILHIPMYKVIYTENTDTSMRAHGNLKLDMLICKQ